MQGDLDCLADGITDNLRRFARRIAVGINGPDDLENVGLYAALCAAKKWPGAENSGLVCRVARCAMVKEIEKDIGQKAYKTRALRIRMTRAVEFQPQMLPDKATITGAPESADSIDGQVHRAQKLLSEIDVKQRTRDVMARLFDGATHRDVAVEFGLGKSRVGAIAQRAVADMHLALGAT